MVYGPAANFRTSAGTFIKFIHTNYLRFRLSTLKGSNGYDNGNQVFHLISPSHPNFFKHLVEHFLKHARGEKEKKQLVSSKHFSTQVSIFFIVFGSPIFSVGHSAQTGQTGHRPASL